MKAITRYDLSYFFSAQMPTKTIKSELLQGTVFEDWEITDDWRVTAVYLDENNVVVIEVLPADYYLYENEAEYTDSFNFSIPCGRIEVKINSFSGDVRCDFTRTLQCPIDL